MPKAVARTYGELMGRVKRLFDRDGAREVPWKVRLAAAEALGSADFRLEGPARARMLRMLEVSGGWLGKYPVTVREYEEFVDAREP